MGILGKLKKRTHTHFERDETGAVTDTRRYNVTGGTGAEPIPDLEPIDELEADTDVKAMMKEAKEFEREQKMEGLREKHSVLQEKRAMKLEDLKQKKEMKSLKGDIRQMKYAPLYKTGSGLVKMGKAVRDRGDSGFVGGGQDKVEVSEEAMSLGTKKEGFFSFGGRNGAVDWGESKKSNLSLTIGGNSQVAFGAKGKDKIDFSLVIGHKTAPKRKKQTKKKTTKRKASKKKTAKRRKK